LVPKNAVQEKSPIFIYSILLQMHQNLSEAIVYISPGNENPHDKAVATEYQVASARFQEAGIPFVSLSDLLTDEHLPRLMDYHHPYLGDEFLKKHFAVSAQHPVLVYASEELNEVHAFELQSPEQIDEILAQVISLKNETGYLFKKSITEYYDIKETISVYGEVNNHNADANFEEEAFRLPVDLRKSIEEIEEAGYLRKLIEYLEEIEKKKRKISRLKITSDYRIYLMDYGMKEVTMSPLPKALYLLFLNHPKGILFKELPDYRTELMNIYKQITRRENPDKALESIIRMTDPWDNSVNEKCSQIRAAFLRVIADDLAKNYYVTGYRGEPKRILLNRELVILEQ